MELQEKGEEKDGKHIEKMFKWISAKVAPIKKRLATFWGTAKCSKEAKNEWQCLTYPLLQFMQHIPVVVGNTSPDVSTFVSTWGVFRDCSAVSN